MAGDLNTSGSGIHPGKPIIWPTGKSSSSTSQPVSSSPTTESAGGVRTSVPARTAPAGSAGAAGEVAPGKPTTAAPSTGATISRPLTVEDLRTHLIQIQIPDSDFNVKLASMMLKDGMELSRTNFVKVLSMLEGTSKGTNMQEAAIMLTMKGIDSPKALQVLGQFMAENPQLAAQMMATQEAMGNLNSALGVAKGLLDPALLSQLSALMASFDGSLKNLAEKYQFAGDNSTKMEDFLNNVRGMKALLDGVQQKSTVSDSAEAQVLQAGLSHASSKLASLIDNLTAQALLSQKGREEVNFQYQQVPNSEAKSIKNVEVVVKREGEGKKATIDYENTQVVLAMQTANLGKMVCSIIVKGKKVYVIFVFNERQYGDEARSLIANEFADLQKKLAEKNFIVSGYQVKVDPAMCNVNPYLIPMLPNLQAQLKKIDLEA
ncbi:MAG: hypothetical protein WC624_03340 [Candidatus Margulisiibacteriota bacterium]